MGKALVGIILGSRADFNIMRRGLESLRVMGVPYWLEFASPHRSPDKIVRFAQGAEDDGLEVLICAAGGSAQVAGMLACYTTLPVIGVPIDSTPLRGQDALFSMGQQPPGVPVATVGINAGENAALLATQILALKYPSYRNVLSHARVSMLQRMETSRKELLSAYPDLCDPVRTAPAHGLPFDSDRDTDPDSTPSDDPEGTTPSPESEGQNREPIRPGAQLEDTPVPSRSNTSTSGVVKRFVPTPIPQEPSAVTDDPGLRDEVGFGTRSLPESDDDFPSHPHADLTPLPLALDSFPSFEQPKPPHITPPAGVPKPFFSSVSAYSSELSDTDEEFAAADTAPQPLKTQVFRIEHANPDEDVLSHAMMVLLEGGIIAFPTDTVYGLAVDASSPDAVRHLYEVKGQDVQQKSLSVLIHTAEMLDGLVKEVPAELETVLETFWPGGLSVLFPKNPAVLESVSDSPSIAIRIPNDPIPLALMRMVGRPLAVINAALSDRPAAVSAQEVMERFDGKIDCILDAGPCRGGATSTVLSVIGSPFEILREGAVPARDLKRILGDRVRD